LRTGIQFAASHQQIRTLLVTSPSEGEGKTLTVANLAVAFAQAGRRVLLVSADLRRPTLERFFETNKSKGLSGCLLEPEYPVESVIVQTDIENLDLLPCGRVPHNPAELLTSPYLKEVINKAQLNRDFVLIDSAPLLPVSDSQTIAPHVDAVLLVVDASQTKRTAALEAARELRQIGAHLAGAVINRVESASPYYDRTGYYTTYTSVGSEQQTAEDDREGALLSSTTSRRSSS
jgi:capsular exopolysaccharide synthesis family protein